MTRQRKDDTIHNLKRENKELQDEIKKLKRELNNEAKEVKRASKAKAKSEPAPKDPAACPDCQNGKIEVVELGAKKLVTCNLLCGYRKVIRNQ